MEYASKVKDYLMKDQLKSYLSLAALIAICFWMISRLVV